MRETFILDKCDNDQCNKVLVDERKSFRIPFFMIRLEGAYWAYYTEKGAPMSLGGGTQTLMFCAEECIFAHITKHFSKIKMAALQT